MRRRIPAWMEGLVVRFYDTAPTPNATNVSRRLRVSMTYVLRVLRDNRRPIRKRGRYLSKHDPARYTHRARRR